MSQSQQFPEEFFGLTVQEGEEYQNALILSQQQRLSNFLTKNNKKNKAKNIDRNLEESEVHQSFTNHSQLTGSSSQMTKSSKISSITKASVNDFLQSSCNSSSKKYSKKIKIFEVSCQGQLDGQLGHQKCLGDCESYDNDNKNNMIKFMNYVMDFKLGLRGSYEGKEKINEENSQIGIGAKKQKQKKKKNAGKSREELNLQVIDKLMKKGIQNKYYHDGFSCDECGADPIVGSRYHCSELECLNNYDACQGCFRSHDESHRIKKVEENGFRNYMSAVSVIFQPRIRERVKQMLRNSHY